MSHFQHFFIILLLLWGSSNLCQALEYYYCQSNASDPIKVSYTITAGKSGQEKFTTVQTAIDSIPNNNSQWIRVQISPGIYNEKVEIPVEKQCIFLEGAGRKLTSIEFDDHDQTMTSAPFISYSDNIVAKGITFKNTYNLEEGAAAVGAEKIVWKQATSARIAGDKSVFYQCGFVGLQDTLFDHQGRHYFSDCYIEGSIDFIYGYGQSIYEGCEIWVNVGRYDPGFVGCITAQKKAEADDTNGFVFKNCTINGSGKARLGRAWGPFSTVIIANSYLGDVVAPDGWDAWRYPHNKANMSYVEAENRGPGAGTSKRVPWMKKLDDAQLSSFLDFSFIDEDGWLAKLPKIL